MKKILVVFGTRPEAIKLAPLIHELKKSSEFDTSVCITSQHKEMLTQVLELFRIEPDFDLDIMHQAQDLFDISSNILAKMKILLRSLSPDIVIVHGDTSTTFSTALACYYLNIKVAHVEAGLRTYNLNAPFPEEFNRQATGLISNYHFAPTNEAKENLINENKLTETIFVTGNTVVDSLFYIRDKLDNHVGFREKILKKLNHITGFDIRKNKYILITGHRRENFGKKFQNICLAIKQIAIDNPNVKFIYPVHLNPNVQEPVNEILIGLENVHLIRPVSYEDFICLMMNCYFILTDSGGIQEEAPSFGKPVLLMRSNTERPEGINAGTVILVGSETDNIIKHCNELLKDKQKYFKMSSSSNPFGDGNASTIITEILKKIL